MTQHEALLRLAKHLADLLARCRDDLESNPVRDSLRTRLAEVTGALCALDEKEGGGHDG